MMLTAMLSMIILMMTVMMMVMWIRKVVVVIVMVCMLTVTILGEVEFRQWNWLTNKLSPKMFNYYIFFYTESY